MNRLLQRLGTTLVLSLILFAVGITFVAAQGPDNSDPTPQTEVEGIHPAEVVGVEVADATSTAAYWTQCQRTYEGIELCSDSSGQTYALKIDTRNPNVRFKAVLANDNPANQTAPPVDSLTTKSVQAMAVAWGAIAAINTDYFGQGHHGVEGLFYRDGMMLDNVSAGYRGPLRLDSCDDNPGDPDTRVCRSSLAISSSNGMNLGFGNRPGYMFNVIGGGPIFMRGGQYTRPAVTYYYSSRDGRTRMRLGGESPFDRDYFSETTRWTVAGLDREGRHLVLVTVGSDQNIDFVVRRLQSLGVDTAIKLDGGGSSQLYHDGQLLVPGRRNVPSALLVFSRRSSGTVTVTRAWVTDADGNVKSSFAPGELIVYRATTENTTGREVTAYRTWEVFGPRNLLRLSGDRSIPAGTIHWYLSTTVPHDAPAGTYTFRAFYSYQGRDSRAQTTFEVRSSPRVQIRLDWGATPRDLDEHLWLPNDMAHVYFRNMGSLTSFPYAQLDRDDVDGYGPETITLPELPYSGTYRFAVHNYSGDARLAGSQAIVRVYNRGNYLWGGRVPSSGSGQWWYVFDIRVQGSSAWLVPVNQISSRAPGPTAMTVDEQPDGSADQLLEPKDLKPEISEGVPEAPPLPEGGDTLEPPSDLLAGHDTMPDGLESSDGSMKTEPIQLEP